jgi:hypothetical protein
MKNMATPKYVAILLFPVLVIGCKEHPASTPINDQRIQSVQVSTATAPAAKIITKDPLYMAALRKPDGDELLKEFSDDYNSKVQEIETKVASISDPDLRNRIRSAQWSDVDKDKFQEQANMKFLQTRLAVFQKLRDDWFEIGHVEYPSTNVLQIESVDASLLILEGGGTIAIDVVSMDQIYSRFRVAAHDGIEAEALHDRSGWDEQGNFGVNTDPEAVANSEKQAEVTVRDKRLVLVGQGDLVAHRIDKLMLVDYDTETILAEFPAASLHAVNLVWRFDPKSAADVPFRMPDTPTHETPGDAQQLQSSSR